MSIKTKIAVAFSFILFYPLSLCSCTIENTLPIDSNLDSSYSNDSSHVDSKASALIRTIQNTGSLNNVELTVESVEEEKTLGVVINPSIIKLDNISGPGYKYDYFAGYYGCRENTHGCYFRTVEDFNTKEETYYEDCWYFDTFSSNVETFFKLLLGIENITFNENSFVFDESFVEINNVNIEYNNTILKWSGPYIYGEDMFTDTVRVIINEYSEYVTDFTLKLHKRNESLIGCSSDSLTLNVKLNQIGEAESIDDPRGEIVSNSNTAHTAGTPVEEDRVEATCFYDGSYDLVTYCTVCNQEIKREHKIISSPGHNYVQSGTIAATYESDGSIVYTCTRCNDSYNVKGDDRLTHHYADSFSYDNKTHWRSCTDDYYYSLKTDEESHSFGDWTIETEPTLTQNGTEIRSCTVCDYFERRQACPSPTLSKLSFVLNDDEESYNVKAVDTSISGTVIIPETYNNLPVTKINNSAFAGCNQITEVFVPLSVIRIGQYAFSSCSSLESIVLPFVGESVSTKQYFGHIFGNTSATASVNRVPQSLHTVTILDGDCHEIINWAFNECSHIKTVNLSSSVTSISAYAFDHCSGLKDINITVNSYKDLLETNSRFFETRNGYDYSVHLLDIDGEEITDLVIPNNVSFIGRYALRLCRQLVNIYIPSSVETIDYESFDYCSSLEKIYAFDNLRSLSDQCYYGDPRLKDFYITITSLDTFFEHGLYTLLGANVHLLDSDGNEITELIVPSSVTNLNNRLRECKSLTSLTLPESLTSLDKEFTYMTLTSITYLGTTDDWITLESTSSNYSNLYSSNINTIICSDNNLDR